MTDVIPYLTIDDKINTCILEDSDIPALIIEGKTDILVYSRMLMKSKLDWNKIDIVVGGCKSNILKYHDNGLEFNYLILLDSDYERYKESLRKHDNIIYTHFYNMENYLTTEEVLEETINDFLCITDIPKYDAKMLIKEAILSIEPFIVACLLKIENNLSMKLEDLSIENQRYWDSRGTYIKLEEFKCFLIERCRDEEEKDRVKDLWDEQYDKKQKIIMESLDQGKIDLILNGKHKLNSVYHIFFNNFKTRMKGRKLEHFTYDLCKNLSSSRYIIELINTIDSHILEHVDDKKKDIMIKRSEDSILLNLCNTATM